MYIYPDILAASCGILAVSCVFLVVSCGILWYLAVSYVRVPRERTQDVQIVQKHNNYCQTAISKRNQQKLEYRTALRGVKKVEPTGSPFWVPQAEEAVRDQNGEKTSA